VVNHNHEIEIIEHKKTPTAIHRHMADPTHTIDHHKSKRPLNLLKKEFSKSLVVAKD